MSGQIQNQYDKRAKEIITDPATPFWVQGCIMKFNEMDVLDVLNGLRVLTDLYELRFKEISSPSPA